MVQEAEYPERVAAHIVDRDVLRDAVGAAPRREIGAQAPEAGMGEQGDQPSFQVCRLSGALLRPPGLQGVEQDVLIVLSRRLGRGKA